ncbi:MAG TPA: glycerol kinase GlpK, partial [Clostridia bacterium]|nr:glycerol kinase GlpK [Clostridia bacterium]
MKKYVVALDQGTTSSRAIAFDREGLPAGSCNIEFKQHFPKPGWVEHNPDDIYKSQMEALRVMMIKEGIEAEEIDSIGITNQRETVVVWDRETGKPIYNAIVWQCRRTASIIEELNAGGYADEIRRKTGLVPDAYFSGSKIKWILDNVNGAREKAEEGKLAAGTIDTWLIYRMSEGRVHATDASNASRTMLFNIIEGRWDEGLCKMLGIPISMLPEVVSSSGRLFDFELDGIKIPVSGIAGDQQASLFGQTCFNPGDVKNTYGTGCFMLMNTGKEPVYSKGGLLTTVAWMIDGKIEYALEGSVFNAGSVIQWIRDNLGLIKTSAESAELAQSVEDTGNVYFVPAFSGLGTPYWDMYARGTVTGLTRGTTKAQFVRAALESLAYRSNDVLKVMEEDSGMKVSKLRVDGGASSNEFLMQFQSDISCVEITRPRVSETTALGAAFLAGIATGFWKS